MAAEIACQHSANNRRRTDIALRYAAGKREAKKPISLAALQRSQLQKLFRDRHHLQLPDDEDGRTFAFVMANVIAKRPGAVGGIRNWLELNAPWMDKDEVQALTTKVIANPFHFKPDTLGKLLHVTEAERTRLRLTIIASFEVNKEQREARRRARKAEAKRERRRAKGMKSRAEYLANHQLSQTKPWEAEGISRCTWYRRQQVSTVRQV